MKKNGFTLIELMIVIAIIALLAAVALPKFANVTDDAKVANVRSNLSVLRTTINMCYAKYGTYPNYGIPALNPNNNYFTAAGVVGAGVQNYYSKTDVELTPAVGTVVASRAITNGADAANNGGWEYYPANGGIYADFAANVLGVANWAVE